MFVSNFRRVSNRTCRVGVVVAAASLVISGLYAVEAIGSTTRDEDDTAAVSQSSPSSEWESEQRLTWSPPKLDNPEVITITDGNIDLRLESHQDYLLKIDGTVDIGSRSLNISGGHDVVLIGGTINAPYSTRSLYLKNQTGTLHVEGIHIKGEGLHEGINLDQRSSGVVQLQSIKIDEVHGSQRGHHADLLLTWSEPKTLRIDRLDGWTTYQSMMLTPAQFGGGNYFRYDLRNIVTRNTTGGGKYYITDSSRLDLTVDNVVVVGPSAGNHRASSEGITTGATSTPSPLTGNPGSHYRSPGYDN